MTKDGLYWDRGRKEGWTAKFTIISPTKRGHKAFQFGFNRDRGLAISGPCPGARRAGTWEVRAGRDNGIILLPYNLWVFE